MCSSVKNTLTNGGECKKWCPMIPNCTPTLGIALVLKSQIFKALVEKVKNTKLGRHDTIGIVLKFRCLNCLCIVHLYLKYMSYDQMKGWESNWEFDSLPQILLEKGSNDLQLENAICCWKYLFEGYKIFPFHVPKKPFLGKICVSKVLGQQ
jgi:hypothetical protein